MNRLLLRTPRGLRRRPYRARRAPIAHTPVVIEAAKPAVSRRIIVAVGVLGLAVAVLAAVGLAVIA